jgi:hypothetical protein
MMLIVILHPKYELNKIWKLVGEEFRNYGSIISE